MKRTVAFLGLGTMGSPMARNIARAGIPLVVWNRTPGKGGEAVEAGARLASSARAAVDEAEVVITMLTGDAALDEVLFGPGGASAGDIAGKLFVDMSTSGPSAARAAALRLAERTARFVDAPVSGSRTPAERGELVVLAGGAADDVSELQPLFGAVAKRVVHAGPVGSGQTLKVVLNGLGCQQLVAFAAMLRLGERAGLSRSVLIDAFTSGAFATPAYVAKRERVLERRYDAPDFVLSLVERDAALCAELQSELGLRLPTHVAAHREVARAVRDGLGRSDLFCIEKLYDRLPEEEETP